MIRKNIMTEHGYKLNIIEFEDSSHLNIPTIGTNLVQSGGPASIREKRYLFLIETVHLTSNMIGVPECSRHIYLHI